MQADPAILIKAAWVAAGTSAVLSILAVVAARRIGGPDIGATGLLAVSMGLVGVGFSIPATRRPVAVWLVARRYLIRYGFVCLGTAGVVGLGIEYSSALEGRQLPFNLGIWLTLLAVVGLIAGLLPSAVQISLLCVAVVVAVGEFSLRLGDSPQKVTEVVESDPIVVEGSYTADYFTPDPVTGYRIRSGRKVSALKRQGEQIIYDVEYTIDDLGWRKTPASGDSDGPITAFFGGSFMFGEGVEDSETLPAAFHDLRPDRRVLNFGVHGWGPQHMLALLEAGAGSLAVPDGRGDLVYVYIAGHMARLTGAMAVHNAWGRVFPYYALRNGVPTRQGNMTTGRPWLSKAFILLSRSKIAEHFGFDLYRLTPPDPDLLVRVIERACELFAEMHGPSRCLIMFLPGAEADMREIQARRRLDAVEIIDATRAFGNNSDMHLIPGDGHPNASGHRVLARLLGTRLQ